MEISELLGIITVLVRGGLTPQQARDRLLPMMGDESSRQALQLALRQFEEQTGRIRTVRRPPTLQGDRSVPGWYPGPSDEDTFWPKLRTYLLQDKGWTQEAVQLVDDASTRIVSLLSPSSLAEIRTRGLVVGYIQSGKTANFTAVIAKAADVNYKFFIVLSGVTNLLRSQTQARLERELVDLNRQHWITLTTIDQDFRPGPVRNVNAFLADSRDLKVLCVVKKNAAVLRRLLRWLRAASREVLSSCPVMVIDDEADLASINTSKYAEERTAINRYLLEILALLPKAAYIGYTATPFANVLIDPSVPQDLYPRDFIVDLPRPEQYFGPERIFGRDALSGGDDESYEGLDVIRSVPQEEVPLLMPARPADRGTFVPTLTPSLRRALRYFWMATAARAGRGQAGQHSTMLIHTTLYTDVHERFKPLVEQEQRAVLRGLAAGDASLLRSLKAQWEEEQTRVPSQEMGEAPVSFDDLRPQLAAVVGNTKVVIENYRSQQRITFGDQDLVQVVIGGNTLSRGLTLEGLIVSFFLRTASAYDTLLQMGRWFGYRGGYSDLPRIWMTGELMEYFHDLATVEQEIRNDIARYDEMTPLEFGVRIRTHPALSVTSPLKMQAAVPAAMSYSDGRFQTVVFRHKDPDWLCNNIRAARNLLQRIATSGTVRQGIENVVLHGIPAREILTFLNEYAFHEAGRTLRRDLLTGYIRAQNLTGELLYWNVVVKGRSGPVETLDLGAGFVVPLLSRTRRRREAPSKSAHIGVLMSRGDVVIDLDLPPERTRGRTDGDLQAEREGQPPLLILYPISKDSAPMRGSSDVGEGRFDERLALEAAEHMIGVGFVFPPASTLTPQAYMTADLSGVQIEELDWDPAEEESDTAQ